MSVNKKVEIMLDQMSAAFSDPDVKQDENLRNMIFNYASELNKTQDTRLVSSKMVKSLALYYWGTKKQLPQAAITLHNQIKKDATIYDGITATALMLPIWF
ncbi:hypothetical protein GCM10025879_13300 [Leuconostoc litchii]|uniref:Bacteriocin immunity protein n=1 Tax=Leuconostoc litchii TaxID=1981069 RepID=A0A6P2CN93_9LACO|nr:bacteriocin immunity protein [Leuconostoc litchii]TYC46354.1 bacteriocin immunity protein [Leuconostoc litchii]GMA70084.1 hypothetical protein GCM10025879_13300 [Leuconostoc litchii]